jgi:hypothetical protein
MINKSYPPRAGGGLRSRPTVKLAHLCPETADLAIQVAAPAEPADAPEDHGTGSETTIASVPPGSLCPKFVPSTANREAWPWMTPELAVADGRSSKLGLATVRQSIAHLKQEPQRIAVRNQLHFSRTGITASMWMTVRITVVTRW